MRHHPRERTVPNVIASITLFVSLVAPHALAHAHTTHATRIAQAGPSISPSVGATAIPAPVGTTAPTATPLAYKYRFVPHNGGRAGGPTIYAVYMNDKKLRSLGPINIKVSTTPDVVKVVSRSNGREGIVPLITPGNFEATSTLPKIPFIAAGMTLEIEFIATTATGRTAIVRVPVLLN